ncbi:hypothetical protein EDD16DRAFT_1564280, partial [Pisolithus croceorrhizus]
SFYGFSLFYKINNIRIRFLLVGLRSGSFFFGLCTVYPYVGLILFLSLSPPPPPFCHLMMQLHSCAALSTTTVHPFHWGLYYLPNAYTYDQPTLFSPVSDSLFRWSKIQSILSCASLLLEGVTVALHEYR